MASYGPPKLPPFRGKEATKVILALQPTPLKIDQATDITAIVNRPFRPVAGTGADSEETLGEVAGPTMFAKKAAAGAKGAKGKAVALAAEFPGISMRPKPKTGAPGIATGTGTAAAAGTGTGIAAGKVYARDDVLQREKQAIEISKLPEELQGEAGKLLQIETTNPYQIEPPSDAFAPLTRSGFGYFLLNQYRPIFPTAAQRSLDVASCAKKGDEGSKEVKIYHYQAFIREYLRYESPYRGLLVYHGLGSGKTCSAIAAAEALFGTRGMKDCRHDPL